MINLNLAQKLSFYGSSAGDSDYELKNAPINLYAMCYTNPSIASSYSMTHYGEETSASKSTYSMTNYGADDDSSSDGDAYGLNPEHNSYQNTISTTSTTRYSISFFVVHFLEFLKLLL